MSHCFYYPCNEAAHLFKLFLLFQTFCLVDFRSSLYYWVLIHYITVRLRMCYRLFASFSSRNLQSQICTGLSSVQSLSCVRLFATPWIAARQASLSITNFRSSLKLTCIESVMPSSHLILCRPLFLLPPIPPSISLFQWVNSSHEVAKVLEFQLQHQSFQRTPRTDLL